MAIDPSKIVWDDAAPAIDVSAVQWDDAQPVEQPKPDTGLETGRQRKPVITGQIRNSPMDIAADQAAGNLIAGGVRGAGSIGATILAPYDMTVDALNGKGLSLESNRQRRADMDSGLQAMGAQPDSALYKTGKLAGEIGGTAGVGGVLANGARAAGAAAPIVQGLASGGLNVAGKTGALGLLTRGVTGAATGGVTAGMVNPEDAKLGAIVGGAIPVSAKALATGARAAGSALTGQVSPEVAALAGRAKQLGIEIPADRITNSKPLNAVAASLEYVPFSGRAATNDKMASQLNRAVSRTFGQDSDNVTQALRTARGSLGGEFDRVLQANTVRVDQQFADDLTQHLQRATKELGSDGEKIIKNQIDEILAKAQAPTLPPLKKIEIANGADLSKVEAGLPPIKDGFTRLYRGESPTVKFQDVFDSSGLSGQRANHLKGERFTDDIKYADYYRQSYGRDAKLSYVDVPTSIAEKGRVDATEVKLSPELFSAEIPSGAPSSIDGQAAYNIKRDLDRIAKRSTPEAFYAKEVKNSLMGALERSLGPDDAAAFLKTRQQYGNMKSMEKLAANGAEGDISVARLANMKNINNKDLQELADISAQFIKTRESPHGALQRLVIGGTGLGVGAGAGMLPIVAGTAALGRATNSLLNSEAAKRVVMGGLLNQPPPLMIKRGLLGASKVAPVLTAQ